MKVNFRIFVLVVIMLAMILSACGGANKVAIVQGKNASEIFVTGIDGKQTLVESFELTIAYCDPEPVDGQWKNCTSASNTVVNRETFNKNTVNSEYIP